MTDDQLPPGPYKRFEGISYGEHERSVSGVVDGDGNVIAATTRTEIAGIIIAALNEQDETPLTEEFVTALLGERRTFECRKKARGRWPLEVTLNRTNGVHWLDLVDVDSVLIPIRTNGELMTWCRQLKIPTTKGEVTNG